MTGKTSPVGIGVVDLQVGVQSFIASEQSDVDLYTASSGRGWAIEKKRAVTDADTRNGKSWGGGIGYRVESV